MNIWNVLGSVADVVGIIGAGISIAAYLKIKSTKKVLETRMSQKVYEEQLAIINHHYKTLNENKKCNNEFVENLIIEMRFTLKLLQKDNFPDTIKEITEQTLPFMEIYVKSNPRNQLALATNVRNTMIIMEKEITKNGTSI